MRDQMQDRPPECGDEAMRDALPALDYGRLDAGRRRAVEAHLAGCVACVEELALLRGARGALSAGVPAIDVDRLAAAVAAATRSAAPVGAPRHPDVVPLASRRPAWAGRWTSRGGLRAAAALLVVALSAGALVTRSADAPDGAGATGAPTVAAVAGPAAGGATPAAAAPGARAASVLGDGFEDLSETELATVLDAIEGEGAALPALEPVVFAPEYAGGGG
jgi:anti-sigma factor RsiW